MASLPPIFFPSNLSFTAAIRVLNLHTIKLGPYLKPFNDCPTHKKMKFKLLNMDLKSSHDLVLNLSDSPPITLLPLSRIPANRDLLVCPEHSMLFLTHVPLLLFSFRLFLSSYSPVPSHFNAHTHTINIYPSLSLPLTSL